MLHFLIFIWYYIINDLLFIGTCPKVIYFVDGCESIQQSKSNNVQGNHLKFLVSSVYNIKYFVEYLPTV